jgi:hypothetical protein
LEVLKFLHNERKILFQQHEALDTDTTPSREGDAWGRLGQSAKVPEKGALVAIGFPKLQGRTGGYARFITIWPPDWKYRETVGELPESPTQV